MNGGNSRVCVQHGDRGWSSSRAQASISLDFPRMLLAMPGTLGIDVSMRELYAGQDASPAVREHCALPMGHHLKATLNALLRHDSRDEPLVPTMGWAGTCGIGASLCDYMQSGHFVKPTASLQANRTFFGALTDRALAEVDLNVVALGMFCRAVHAISIRQRWWNFSAVCACRRRPRFDGFCAGL